MTHPYQGFLPQERIRMKSLSKCLLLFAITSFAVLSINSTADARGWRRAYFGPRVVHRPVYVAPVRVYAPVRTYVAPAPVHHHYYRPPVHVVTPRVQVHVGGYGGVSVNVGGWGW